MSFTITISPSYSFGGEGKGGGRVEVRGELLLWILWLFFLFGGEECIIGDGCGGLLVSFGEEEKGFGPAGWGFQ